MIGDHTIGLELAHFGTVRAVSQYLNTYLVLLVGFRGKNMSGQQSRACFILGSNFAGFCDESYESSY